MGEKLLRRLEEDLGNMGRVESQPNLDGRNMVMVLVPKKDYAKTSDNKEKSAAGN
ncbi:hypothetical protein BH24ACT22_BH24ACT22_08580 [soil metagenome]